MHRTPKLTAEQEVWQPSDPGGAAGKRRTATVQGSAGPAPTPVPPNVSAMKAGEVAPVPGQQLQGVETDPSFSTLALTGDLAIAVRILTF